MSLSSVYRTGRGGVSVVTEPPSADRIPTLTEQTLGMRGPDSLWPAGRHGGRRRKEAFAPAGGTPSVEGSQARRRETASPGLELGSKRFARVGTFGRQVSVLVAVRSQVEQGTAALWVQAFPAAFANHGLLPETREERFARIAVRLAAQMGDYADAVRAKRDFLSRHGESGDRHFQGNHRTIIRCPLQQAVGPVRRRASRG